LIPFLARLFDIKMHNGTLSADWKRAVVFPIHKGGDRSLFTNYRQASLTSMVCKEMEHVIASYLRHVWDKNDWLYEGQHGFIPGYSCESQVIKVCQEVFLTSAFDGGGLSTPRPSRFTPGKDPVPIV